MSLPAEGAPDGGAAAVAESPRATAADSDGHESGGGHGRGAGA